MKLIEKKEYNNYIVERNSNNKVVNLCYIKTINNIKDLTSKTRTLLNDSKLIFDLDTIKTTTSDKLNNKEVCYFIDYFKELENEYIIIDRLKNKITKYNDIMKYQNAIDKLKDKVKYFYNNNTIAIIR